jgi:ABC-type uncharacterized transport system involved in gliding motility auxiliary subunit
MPWPGAIYIADGKPDSLKVTTLLRPALKTKWGRHQFSDYFGQNFMGQMSQTQPKRFLPGDAEKRPALAVEVTGVMASAYAKIDPTAKLPEAKVGEPPPELQMKKGILSAKPVRVIVVADTDFASNGIFNLYRNAGDQLSSDDAVVLRNLRNVQFIANAVDSLASDQDFLALRSRRPQARPLSRIQDVITETAQAKRESLELATNVAETAVTKANDDFKNANEKIDSQTDLDENAKEQLKADRGSDESRKLQKKLAEIEYDRDVAARDADIIQDQKISRHLFSVKWFALGIPAFVMLLLVLAVAGLRFRAERSHIPASRKRSLP